MNDVFVPDINIAIVPVVALTDGTQRVAFLHIVVDWLFGVEEHVCAGSQRGGKDEGHW